MKNLKILFALLVIFVTSANAQYRLSPYAWEYYSVKSDSLFVLPKILTNPFLLEDGAVRYNAGVMQLRKSGAWVNVSLSADNTLDGVLATGNSTGRNIAFTDTSIVRWDKFTDFASLQFYTLGDTSRTSNMIFTMGDNSYYGGGLQTREGFIFRKDTSALGGIPPYKFDTLMVMNDAEVIFTNRNRALSPLMYVNRLNSFIGLGTRTPAYTLSVMGNGFVSGGNLTVASAGNDVVTGGNAAIQFTSTGNSTNAGITELQSLYGGVSFQAPIVMQRLGGSVAIATTSITDKLNVGGNVNATGYGLFGLGVSAGSTTTPTSTIQINGSFAALMTTITTNIVAGSFHKYNVNNTSNIVITLPAASTCVGREYVIKKISNNANTITITPASGTIDFAATLVMSTYLGSRIIYNDGTNWWVE